MIKTMKPMSVKLFTLSGESMEINSITEITDNDDSVENIDNTIFMSKEFTLTIPFDTFNRQTKKLLLGSNNWRKLHGLPMYRKGFND